MQSEARVAIWSVFINTRKLMEQFSHLQWPLTGCIWGSRVCSESTAWRWRVCPRDTAAHAGTCHHTRHTSKMFDGVSNWGQNDTVWLNNWKLIWPEPSHSEPSPWSPSRWADLSGAWRKDYSSTLNVVHRDPWSCCSSLYTCRCIYSQHELIIHLLKNGRQFTTPSLHYTLISHGITRHHITKPIYVPVIHIKAAKNKYITTS